MVPILTVLHGTAYGSDQGICGSHGIYRQCPSRAGHSTLLPGIPYSGKAIRAESYMGSGQSCLYDQQYRCLLSREVSSCLTVSTSSVEVGQGGCLLLVPAVASAILLFLSDEMDRGREPHYVVHAGERWVQEMSSFLELQCYSVPGMHPCRCCMTPYM